MITQQPRFLDPDGHEYLTPADACDQLIAAGMRSSAAYSKLARLAQRSIIRTIPTSARTRAYHAGDVAKLARAIQQGK